jgi:hypothetical protein
MSLIKVNQLATLDGATNRQVTANTGLTIPDGEDLRLSGTLYDGDDSPGLAGQYLISNGENVFWSSLPQDLTPTSNVTFNNVIVSGDITVAGTASFDLSSFTTSDLIEGGNLYYTNARARSAISAVNSGSGDGSLSYNSASGQLSYSGPTNLDYRSAFDAVTFTDTNVRYGQIGYSSATGRFTFVGATRSDIRNAFSAESNDGSPTSLGSFGYDATQGQFSYLGPTVEVIRNQFTAGGDLVYDNTTGEFSVDLGAVSPTLIYQQINQSPTTTSGDPTDSIQNLHVNNANYQLINVQSVSVNGSNVGTVNATGHQFQAGDRIRLYSTASYTSGWSDHLNGIYNVNTASTNQFTITTENVSAGTYNAGTPRAKRISVFTGDLVIDGSINVNGSKIGLSDLFVGTNLIRLNSDLPDSQQPAQDGTDDAIIEVNRGAFSDVALKWNEIARRWQFTNDGLNYNNILLPSETDFGGAEEFGASGDPARYNVLDVTFNQVGGLTETILQVPDITKFKQNHTVKVFGISKTNLSTPGTNAAPSAPVAGSTPAASYESSLFATAVKQYYVYAAAHLDLVTGDVSTATVQNPAGSTFYNVNVNDLNEANYNNVSVTKAPGKAICLYRAIVSDDGTGTAANTIKANFAANVGSFKLIAVLGPRYFEGVNTINYKDYGSYDVVVNSLRDTNGDFGPNPIHVPHTPRAVTGRQGWITSRIKANGIDEAASTITLEETGLFCADESDVYLYHDDTLAIQAAIDDSVSNGRNFLVIPGGTYLITQLRMPDNFTFRGLADATVLHRQYWSTDNINDNATEGAHSAMILGTNYDGNDPTPEGLKECFIGDIIFDGSVKYQVLDAPGDFGEEANNAVINAVNSKFLRINNVKVRYGAGPALFAPGSENLTIDSCTFYNGADVERFGTPCVIADEGDTTIVNSSLFRDYPGPLDFTSTSVLSVNGCTIRNCGSGLKIYGSNKTDVLNNLILGPADEWIPVPDSYDSDFNSVNFPIEAGIQKNMPVLQYVVSGAPYDLTDTIRRVEVFRVTVSGGAEVFDLDNPIKNGGQDLFQTINDGNGVDPSVGQTQFAISAQNSTYLNSTYPSTVNAYNVYRAYGLNYVDVGSDTEPTLGTGTYNSGTQTYTVNCNALAHNSVIIGSYVKLVAHSYAPAPTPTFGTRIWKVIARTNLGGGNYTITLESWEEDGSGNIQISSSLTGVGTVPTTGGGYFSIRNKFIIAKGIISITV